MTSDRETGLPGDAERAGRRRRGLVLVVVGFLLLAPIVVLIWYSGYRADTAAERLRDDLLEDAADVTPEQVREAWLADVVATAEEAWPGRELEEQLFPDVDAPLTAASYADPVLQAAFSSGWWLEDRCVRIEVGGDRPAATVSDSSC
jgi:hypothetical protein